MPSGRSTRLLLAIALSAVLAACAGPGSSPGTSPGTTSAATTSTASSAPSAAATSAGEETPAATTGGDETPGSDETPGATTGGEETPGGSPGESPEGSAAAGGGELPTGATGALFAFGVKYTEGADEIATSRIDLFTENNPDVDVTFSETDFDEAGFLTALQTDQPPDVVRMDTSMLATYAARGVVTPIDDCMAQYGADPNNYYEAVRNQATIDGQMYGIPEFMTTMNWLVNESAFSEANLDAASFDFSDWDAIRSANDALVQTDGSTVSRIGIDPKVPEFFPLWAKANGVDLISADGTTAQIDQPQVLETLQFVVDLVNAHGGPSPFLDFRGTWDFFGENNEFVANQVGAFPFEQWYLNVLAGSSPDAAVRAAPFVDREGNGLTMATGSSLAITTAATNPEAACAFAVTLTSEDAWVRAAEERVRIATDEGSTNTGVFIAHQPATERIFGEIIPADQIPAPWGDNVQVYLDNWENAFALPPSPANATIFPIGPTASESIIATMIDRALQGEDLQQVLTEANADAQAAIDDAANQ